MYFLYIVIVGIKGLNYAWKFQKNSNGKMLNLAFGIFYFSSKRIWSAKQLVHITFPGVQGQYVLILHAPQ